MDKLVLTEEEEKAVHYCENFCPVHYALMEYNGCHRPPIFCPSEMCERTTEAYVLYMRGLKNHKGEE